MPDEESYISRSLWKENLDLARASLESPFVQGMRRGDLPAVKFKAYIAQDAYFLEAFARAYALAIAYCPDRKGLYHFVELLQGAIRELKLHRAYADRWSVNLDSVVPGRTTSAYIDFLLDVARSGRVDETCAAMTPCMRLYAYLGQELKRAVPVPNNMYQEWIDTYSDPGFKELASTLEALLDHYAIDEGAVNGIYRRAMELELNFFRAHE